MKVRWRKHEFILITIIVAMTIVKYILESFSITEDIHDKYVEIFKTHNIQFNYLTDILLTRTAVVLLLYAVYLIINFFITPRYFSNFQQKNPYSFITVIVHFLIISYLLALGVNVATFYAHPFYFNYGGFNLFALFGYNDTPLENIFTGYFRALILVSVYAVYLLIRERVIHRLESSQNENNYRILVVNQCTTLLIIFAAIPIAASSFNLISDYFLSVYFAFFAPASIVFMAGIYWIFPMKEGTALDFQSIIFLLITTFAATFVYLLFGFITHSTISTTIWLLSWVFQMVVISPLSWFIYLQRKDKIIQFKSVEKALVKSKTDLLFLRSQINPHFLFNSLNTLYGKALIEGSKETAQGIQKLGDMMRFMLHENHLDFIPMTSEISYLKNYIDLQKLRIQNSQAIKIEININEDSCNHLISPMLLIPFVENAFKYGISLIDDSWIMIGMFCDERYLYFETRNSIHYPNNNEAGKEDSGIGLQNVKDRLQIFYPAKHTLTHTSDNGEFILKLKIDLQ